MTGHTITVTATTASNHGATQGIYVMSGATLNINYSFTSANTSSCNDIAVRGTLNINSGTSVFGSAKLTVCSGGVVNVAAGASIDVNQIVVEDGGVLNLNGGQIRRVCGSSTLGALNVKQGGLININNGASRLLLYSCTGSPYSVVDGTIDCKNVLTSTNYTNIHLGFTRVTNSTSTGRIRTQTAFIPQTELTRSAANNFFGFNSDYGGTVEYYGSASISLALASRYEYYDLELNFTSATSLLNLYHTYTDVVGILHLKSGRLAINGKKLQLRGTVSYTGTNFIQGDANAELEIYGKLPSPVSAGVTTNIIQSQGVTGINILNPELRMSAAVGGAATLKNFRLFREDVVYLRSQLTVNNTLNLERGKLRTDVTGPSFVIVTNTASTAVLHNTTGFTATFGYVSGKMRRYVVANTSYDFPVGYQGETSYRVAGSPTPNHRRATVIFRAMSGITYLDAFYNNPISDCSGGVSAADGSLSYIQVHPEGSWDITPNTNSYTADYDIRLYTWGYNTPALADNFYGVLKRNSGSTNCADWNTGGGTLPPAGGWGRIRYFSGPVDISYAERSTLPTFCEFAIGIAGGCSTPSATSNVSTWTGGMAGEWNTAANWSGGTAPTVSDNVTLPASTSVSVTGGTAFCQNLVIPSGSTLTVNSTLNCRNITVNAGGTLVINGGGTLKVIGDWTNNGTFSAANLSTVVFEGGNPQNMSGSNNFYNLTIDKCANDVTMLSPGRVRALLLLESGNLISNGNLTLISTAALTAMVVNNASNVVVGNATVERHVTPYSPRPTGLGYTYFSNPTTSGTVGSGFADDMALVHNPAYKFNCWLYPAPYSSAPFPNLYAYSESLVNTGTDAACMGQSWDKFESGWVSAPAAMNMETMQGFCVNIAGNTTVDITGVLNNGSVNRSITRTNPAATNSGWNLVGNPYPAPINWDLVYNMNSALVNAQIIRRVATGTYSGTWAYYVANVPGSGTNGATEEIAAMQGFFLRANANGNFTMDNSVRLTSYSNPKFFRNEKYFDLVRLSLSKGGKTDETCIYFGKNASDALETERDAEKVQMNSAPFPNIFSQAEAKPLAINGLSELREEHVIPLGFYTPEKGIYTVKIAHAEGLENVEIILEDRKTGEEHDLRKSDFSFNAEESVFENRFFLRFAPAKERLEGLALDLALFPNPAQNTLNLQLSKTVNATISVCDIAGREVLRGEKLGKNFSFDVSNLPKGIYIVKITTETGEVSGKFAKE
jgi:hypothetical protein